VGCEWASARVAVVGLGASGRACVQALQSWGAQVVEVDDAVARPGVLPGPALDLAAVDLVVASPGWPPYRSPLPQAVARGLPVWSEVELAWRARVRPDAPWLCLTGTNGKTTTVAMAAAILQAAGRVAVAAGNVGLPLVDAAADPTAEVFVCELSSFQLHFTASLAPWAAAWLNLSPDHLDWHGGFDAYARDKARIADGAEHAVIVGPDPVLARAVARWASPAPAARLVRFTAGRPAPGEVGVAEAAIVDRAWGAGEGVELAGLADLAHLGFGSARSGTAPLPAGDRRPDAAVPRHLLLDALAAAALTRSLGIGPAAIRAGLAGFTPGDHRLAVVATVGGVTYIDDSKATNPHAAEAAFAEFGPESVIWIAGGLTKGTDLEGLVAVIGAKLRGTVAIGRDRTALTGALRRHASHLPLVEIEDGETDGVMRRAVEAAHRLAAGRGVVLLAPAAASQDQFASYAHRGEAYAAAVRELGA
jgi:UDP-N-acetylmuramoylalanine--D-glutamate ligase